MNPLQQFHVIIIGGSYAGLSASMALGRSLRRVLIIDSGQPCNQQTPHAHNFITHDGESPAAISAKANQQVLAYDTVTFEYDRVTNVKTNETGFVVQTENGNHFNGRKILFASGIKDIMPPIEGIEECWGISVLHCPYCHGYEVNGNKLGVLGNGDVGFEFGKLISNWTKDLTIYTDGDCSMNDEQRALLKQNGIDINEKKIVSFEHTSGHLQRIHFDDKSSERIQAIFVRAAFRQHTDLPERLGCAFNQQGFIAIDDLHRTSIAGLYAAGDCTNPARALSIAVGSGTKAGASINKDLIEEDIYKRAAVQIH